MTYYTPQIEAENSSLTKRLVFGLLYVGVLTSGFVLVEPAPFDMLILLSIFIFLFTDISIPVQMKWILTIGFIHLIGNFIGALASNHFGESYMHVIVTTYMMLFAFGLIIMIYNEPHKVLDTIIKAYVWAAIFTAILGIMGYFNIAGTFDTFTRYGRAKGGFKDSNVYAPFLIPPMLYLVERIVNGTLKYKIFDLAKFSILLLGLLLSFSRGAWGGFIFAALIMFASMYYTARTNRYRVQLSLILLIAFIVMVMAILIALSIPSIGNLLLERAAITQSYDTQEGGRFTHHVDALRLLIENPWGIGAKEFGRPNGEDVHNTYLATFTNGGWISGFSFQIIIFSTLIIGFKYCFRDYELRKHFVVFYAAFVALAIEAYIIDIDHWRILYVILGCVWGIIFYQKYNPKSQTHSIY